MSEDLNHLRAGNADRERVVRRLNDAFAEGRLDVHELEERVGAAYAARTLGDLKPLTTDLPPSEAATSVPVPTPDPEPVERRERMPFWGPPHRVDVASWLSVSLICATIWGVNSLAAWSWTYPWWLWVAGPWGVLMFVGGRGYGWYGRSYRRRDRGRATNQLRGTIDTRQHRPLS